MPHDVATLGRAGGVDKSFADFDVLPDGTESPTSRRNDRLLRLWGMNPMADDHEFFDRWAWDGQPGRSRPPTPGTPFWHHLNDGACNGSRSLAPMAGPGRSS